MRVLMLGWEFPPFISGGLGTACYGLTRALDRRGVGVTFVLPKAVGRETSSHVHLISPDHLPNHPAFAPASAPTEGPSTTSSSAPPAPSSAAPAGSDSQQLWEATEATSADDTGHTGEPRFRQVSFIGVPAGVPDAYARPGSMPIGRHPGDEDELEAGAGDGDGDAAASHRVRTGDGTRPGSMSPALSREDVAIIRNIMPEMPFDRAALAAALNPDHGSGTHYGGDLFSEAQRYAAFVLAAVRYESFDVIHAHDWLTYPAGLAIRQQSGKPLVVHVHSTEFDRSGVHVNQRIYDIERRGMQGADHVIAVSQLTKNTVVARYGVPSEKVDVVYNGVEIEPTELGMTGIEHGDKIVLYFGRITMQKGPEYFIRAAKRVLEYMDDVKFVVAGSGDMAQRMIEMAAELGIGHKVLFTGFLRGRDIQRVFAMADLYVMPSVSEPFGIAPLEAMGHNVPVLISKTSGVSEVLTHALKVDFWDIDDMADKIIAVLRHPTLSRTLREHGAFEVRRLTWDGAADRCEQVYRRMLADLAR